MPDEYKNYEKKDVDDSSQYYVNINDNKKIITKLYNTLAPKWSCFNDDDDDDKYIIYNII